MYKLTFYVPETHVEPVKQALFEQGAGKIGNYDCCCWQTKGVGQYRPLENSTPFKGDKHTICKEPEYLVEMVCDDHLINVVIETLIAAHPYETPAYAAWPIYQLDTQKPGV